LGSLVIILYNILYIILYNIIYKMFIECLVEFLGTMLLIYVILATGNWAAIGATLSICILLGGKISGGSYNPAVTIALYTAGKLAENQVLPYIIAEVLGGLLAYQLYKMYVLKSTN